MELEQQPQPPATIIELLALQRAPDGEEGLRLALHWSLIERLELSKYPYHWCALTGNVPLAIHLYRNRCINHQQIFIATLTSGGVNGQAHWQKPLDATPADIARLAGHARLGSVLDHMEVGVPLTWHPSLHHMYPVACRAQAQQVMRGLCRAPWFIRLPGTARAAITQSVMEDLCRREVWGMVEEREWSVAGKGDFGPSLMDDLSNLLRDKGGDVQGGGARGPGALAPRPLGFTGARGGTGGGPSQADALQQAGEIEPLRAFQFRMAFTANAEDGGHAFADVDGAAIPRKARWLRLLLRSVVPLLALAVTARECKKLRREQIATYVTGMLAGLQLPGVLLLLGQLLAGN